MSVMISHCKETNRPGMSCYHCDEIGKKSNFILWIFITLFGYELIMIIASVMRDKLSKLSRQRMTTRQSRQRINHDNPCTHLDTVSKQNECYTPQCIGIAMHALVPTHARTHTSLTTAPMDASIVWTINRSSLDYQPQQYGLSTAAGSGGSGGRGDEYANGGHGRGHQGYGPYRGGSASAMRVRHSPMNGHGNIHVERRNNNQVVGMQEKINGRFRIKIRINGRFKMHIHPMDVGY
eukprot:670764_1